MQRRASRPTSSARALVRPLSSRIEVEGPRPVARMHARPDRGVRVHPLARRRARQQLEHHLQVPESGHDLLDPHHRHEHLGQGRAHPAVPLGLDDDDAPGVGAGEVGARDGHARAEECVAKEGARRRGQRAGIVAETLQPEPLPEQVADLRPVLVDRRHEEVRGPLTRQLHDQLGQVGLQGVNPGRLERVVQSDLVCRERLHLHDLVARLRRARSPSRRRWPRPRPVPSGRRRRAW